MGQDSSQTGQADYYLAQVSSASLYYPFGWEMPGRKFVSGEDYRFGFNGKEDDRDWGTQNVQDYGFRLYNPSIGKFLSVDPLSPDYPWNSCYAFAEGSPIANIDLDGLEIFFAADGEWLGKFGDDMSIREVSCEEVANVQSLLATGNHSPMGAAFVKGILEKKGRPLSEETRKNIQINSLVDVTAFVRYSTVGDCWKAAVACVKNAGYSNVQELGTDYWSGTEAWSQQMYIHPDREDEIKESFKSMGKVLDIDKTRMKGLEVINKELESGRPVIVGLYADKYKEKTDNEGSDKTSVHYIVLVGRHVDDNGSLRYTAFENATSNPSYGTNEHLNTFSLQKDGTITGKTIFHGSEDESPWTITTVRRVSEDVLKD